MLHAISTHAPARGATDTVGEAGDALDISTHAPARGATTLSVLPLVSFSLFQPTLPHGERHSGCQTRAPADFISTHAPARGATASAVEVVLISLISTHAPARGATLRMQSPPATTRNFNPRSRTGSDILPEAVKVLAMAFQPTLPHGERPRCARALCGLSGISTHAPARGATLPSGWRNSPYNISTHAPARGATAHSFFSSASRRLFQPTLPHGERHVSAYNDLRGDKFQPTLPHGERPSSYTLSGSLLTFQPTLPHGERPAGSSSFRRASLFQPTLPHGERLHGEAGRVVQTGFQPTLPHGERLTVTTPIDPRHYFNPRSRTGSDLCRAPQ